MVCHRVIDDISLPLSAQSRQVATVHMICNLSAVAFFLAATALSAFDAAMTGPRLAWMVGLHAAPPMR